MKLWKLFVFVVVVAATIHSTSALCASRFLPLTTKMRRPIFSRGATPCGSPHSQRWLCDLRETRCPPGQSNVRRMAWLCSENIRTNANECRGFVLVEGHGVGHVKRTFDVSPRCD